MSPIKPYLIRAAFDWISDNGLTLYITVLVTDDLDVPSQHVSNGEITFNLAESAVRNLRLDNEVVSFSARFGGIPRDICVYVNNVVSIIARENGLGFKFDSALENNSTEEDRKPMVKTGSHLKLVK